MSNGARVVAISPDGSRIAYAALSERDSTERSVQRLYLRPTSEDVATPADRRRFSGGWLAGRVRLSRGLSDHGYVRFSMA